MRRSTLLLAAAALLLAAVPASAKPAYFAKAKADGIKEITTCKSCHAQKMSKDSLNEVGKWLLKEKAARKAKDVDPIWLKEYFAKKDKKK
jgi:cytochrome c553